MLWLTTSHQKLSKSPHCYDRTSSSYADTSDCIISIFFLISLHRSLCMILSERHRLVWYDLEAFLCMIWSRVTFLYDINLGATATTILSTRGVQIPIYLVTSATDSLGEAWYYLSRCQYRPQTLSLSSCVNWAILRRTCRPPETPSTPGISPTPSQPRITHIVTVQVLSQSTSSKGSVYNGQSNLVIAILLKSSRTFSPNVTLIRLSTQNLEHHSDSLVSLLLNLTHVGRMFLQ